LSKQKFGTLLQYGVLFEKFRLFRVQLRHFAGKSDAGADLFPQSELPWQVTLEIV
jgi:hypothetical protein